MLKQDLLCLQIPFVIIQCILSVNSNSISYYAHKYTPPYRGRPQKRPQKDNHPDGSMKPRSPVKATSPRKVNNETPRKQGSPTKA